jgi:hypothetical protein
MRRSHGELARLRSPFGPPQDRQREPRCRLPVAGCIFVASTTSYGPTSTSSTTTNIPTSTSRTAYPRDGTEGSNGLQDSGLPA